MMMINTLAMPCDFDILPWLLLESAHIEGLSNACQQPRLLQTTYSLRRQSFHPFHPVSRVPVSGLCSAPVHGYSEYAKCHLLRNCLH